MARIIAGIAASHTPTIGFAKDTKTPNDPGWGDVFKVFRPMQDWLEKKKPDVLLFIYNDHITSFFFDHYSPFVLGVDDRYVTADEGGGPREYPPVRGHTGLARHIGSSLFADEFDISFFQKKPIDHGLFSPLSMMTDRGKAWNGAVIPLQVGVLQFPIPTPKRCYKLGKALRKAIESYPEDITVAICSTGGLSHQVHGERCGFNNTEWDNEFLDLLENDPESLLGITHAEHVKRGGLESAEIIMWLIMRGALGKKIRCVHRDYCLPSMTAIATIIYENDHEPDAAEVAAQRKLMAEQLAGVEKIDGTHPFTLEVSHRAFRLNDFLHRLVEPEHRRRFLEDTQALCDEFGLTDEERRLLDARDWIGLIHYGVIFFCLEKMAAVVGVGNPDVYAQMRGETLAEFQKSRNVSMQYSVAGGKEAQKLADKE
ncbi:MAG: gallate dioxygenase [Gammaproteobacteria bacterium]|nr:gallate dioxygenase [Gammaproteobacteria bacterium]MDH4256552.1 gallate dioxygenase [Gammaproteobacteria bacterium]MDH5311181.1 gallate dioxygenase [Gammaproteobacteria bacterium]